MEFSKIYFGKLLSDLEYSDVESFFRTDREESDQLEFKSNPPSANLDQMVKVLAEGIGAFLNSSGGLLIWGALIGVRVTGKKEKVFTGSLTNVPAAVEKDWLISRVSDKLVPLPSGVRVQIIYGEGEQKVCVFEVDESPASPHQVEGTYYMRIDGQKKPAPHHYVEALFKKIRFPRIECHIRPRSADVDDESLIVAIDFIFINFSEFENEEDFSFEIMVQNGFFFNEQDRDVKSLTPRDINYSRAMNVYKPVKSIPVLHYGRDRMETKKIFFTLYDRKENGDFILVAKKAKIIVFFGGKKSPMKVCYYDIDINLLLDNEFKDINSAFTIVRQNMLMADIHAEKGRTKDIHLDSLEVLRK